MRDESPTDPRIKEQKKKELEGIFKYVQKTAAQPPKHEHAKGWIATELGKKDKAPIRRDVQPHKDAGTHEDMQTNGDRKSTRLNSSHSQQSRMPSSA